MPHDDHIDDPAAAPDDPIAPGEQARAESLARSLDLLVAGNDLPPAMDSDERALVQVAGIVRAAFHDAEIAAARRDSLIDQALSQGLDRVALRSRDETDATADATTDAADRPRGDADSAADAGSDSGQPGDAGVTDLGAFRRRRLSRILPWAVTAMAAAAILLLLVTRPSPPDRVAETYPDTSIPVEHRSRPADALIGQIPRERVGHARERIDMIFADRMAGYRDLSLRGGAR